jgi:hypothetical protein
VTASAYSLALAQCETHAVAERLVEILQHVKTFSVRYENA